VSRDKGNAAPAWVAAWLRPWWPDAEKTPNSRPGRDILGTPGTAIEVKTEMRWSHKWLAQAAKYAGDGEIALVVYLPPGCGETAVGDALVVLPLRQVMPLLTAAGYAPQPTEVT
jgi:hypothetical protein